MSRQLQDVVDEALSTEWPATTFVVTGGQRSLDVTWTDGPGRRQVLNQTRLAGAGTDRVTTRRTLTPVTIFSMVADGVTYREAVDTPATDPEPCALILARCLPENEPVTWWRAVRAYTAFAHLTRTQQEVAAVLARENPLSDPYAIARIAAALDRGAN